MFRKKKQNQQNNGATAPQKQGATPQNQGAQIARNGTTAPRPSDIKTMAKANRSYLSLPAIFAVLICLATLCTAAGIALMLTKSESEGGQSALLELELERVARIAYAIKNELNQRGTSAFEVNQDMFPMTLEQLGFARFPSNGEVYHSRNNGKSIRVGGLGDNKVWVDSSAFMITLPPLTSGISYVMTTYGDLVNATDSELTRSGKVTGRDVVKKFFKAGVDHAIYIDKDASGDDVVLAYHMVPGTNLVYFVEKPLVNATVNLRKHMGSIALWGAGIAALIALIAFASFRFHLRHLEDLRRYAWKRLGSENSRNFPAPALPASSEFHVFKELLETEARRSDAASAMITSFSGYVQMLRNFQLRLHNALDVQAQLSALAEFAYATLQPRQSTIKLRFQPQTQLPGSTGTVSCAIQIVTVSSQAANFSPARWLSEPASKIILGRLSKSPNAQYDNLGAHLPLRCGDTFVGVLTFEEYPNPVHFNVLEPLLSMATAMLAERLERSSGAVHELLTTMNELGAPPAEAPMESSFVSDFENTAPAALKNASPF